MPYNIFGQVLNGALGLFGGAMHDSSQRQMNRENVALQREINAQNLAHSEKWNQKNYNLASQAQASQLAQQKWANEQYIESRDYDRALQQQLFDREDTSIQRAVQDATSAGFSPLAALGMPAGAGQVVSGSSAPGSMVSNNQASVQSAGQVAPQVEALTGMSGALSSIGSMIGTMAESMSARQHQKEMQKADIMAGYKRLGLEYVYEGMLQDDQQDFLSSQKNIEHMYELMYIAETARFNEAMELLRQRGAKDLQDDKQQHDLQTQQSQQDFEADYRTKTLSATLEDSLVLGKEILLPVIRKFSPKLADWMSSNTYGEDVLIQIVRSAESAIPFADSAKDAMKPW